MTFTPFRLANNGPIVLFVTVFWAGFACLAIEVAAPRVAANIYGSTHVVWAAGIVSTLGGLALGYYLGSIRWRASSRSILCVALATCAPFVVVIKELSTTTSQWCATASGSAILFTVFVSVIVPAVWLGTITPLVISTLLSTLRADPVRITGLVFAVSTIGGIAGGLWIVFTGLETLGVSGCLWSIALLLVVLSILNGGWRIALGSVAALALCWLNARSAPSIPKLVWEGDTEYQTVRILRSADQCRVALLCGPACESLYDRCSHVARLEYARTILQCVKAVRPHSVLMIGGAGNGIGLELQTQGTVVDVIELDGRLLGLGAEFFGKMRGLTFVGDGRGVVRWAGLSDYGCVVLDAFTAPGVVPSHLLSVEGLTVLKGALRDNAPLIMSLHGAPAGEASSALQVIVRTAQQVFKHVRLRPVIDENESSNTFQNLILICSDDSAVQFGRELFQSRGRIATDDSNPLDALFLQALDAGRKDRGPYSLDWIIKRL